jgi:hypothetical protein
MAKKVKVVVYVDGGNVQSIMSNADVEVEMIDADNLREGDTEDGNPMTRDQVTALWEKKTKGMKEVY